MTTTKTKASGNKVTSNVSSNEKPKRISFKNMDLSKLQIGQEIKNYKELCELISIPEKKANSKVAQLKELQRYVNYERRGQKFIITDIYKTPLERDDNRMGIFTKCIEIVLLYNLAHPDENYYFRKSRDPQVPKAKNSYAFFKTDLWKALGLVNEFYGYRGNDDRLIYGGAGSGKYYNPIKDNNISAQNVGFFYRAASDKLSKIVERALNSLKVNSVLMWHEEMQIFYKKDRGDGVFELTHKVADSNEIDQILSVEREVISTKFNGSSRFQIIIHNQYKQFIEEVNRILREEYGWEYAQRKIRIDASRSAALDMYSYAEKSFMLDAKNKMNAEISSTLIKDAEKARDKSNDKLIEYTEAYNKYKEEFNNIPQTAMNRVVNGEYKYLQNAINAENKRVAKLKPEGEKPFVYPESYVIATKILVDEFIKLRNNSTAMELYGKSSGINAVSSYDNTDDLDTLIGKIKRGEFDDDDVINSLFDDV